VWIGEAKGGKSHERKEKNRPRSTTFALAVESSSHRVVWMGVWRLILGGLFASVFTLLGTSSAAADPLLARPVPHVLAPQPLPPPVPEPGLKPAPVQLSEQAACDPNWAIRVYKDARASVVRIDNAEGLGTGFVVFSPLYVATAFHVVALGRPLSITAADGSVQGARIVATDPQHDLALLQLDHPIVGAPPLLTETMPAPVGTPVLVIGHPFALLDRVNRSLDGLLYWTATQGIISEKSDEFVQTDAAVNPGNSGGPMLACDGHLLGLVTAKLGGEAIGFAVPMARVDALRAKIGKESPYSGRVTPEVEVGAQMAWDNSYSWLGFSLGFGFVAHDRWSTELRGGLLWATSTPEMGQAVISNTGFRILGELDETYRFLLFERPFPGYFLLGLGVAGMIDRLAQTTLGEAPVTPKCMPLDSLACNQIIGVQTHQTNKRLSPMATAGFIFAGSLKLTYAFQWNVDQVSASEHRLLLVVPF
jgi:S1-C subfamily serine protease